ncbi:MAG: CBS domain-containing protein [Methanomicrobiaceae archaeon]|nr:CBS domain-containing protein [Methanomicrobiaceae archaeon]
MQASDIMSSPVYVLEPKDTASHARNLMIKHRISRCPVIEEGALCGIITKKDLAYRLRQKEPVWRRRPLDKIPVEILMTPDPLTVETGTTVSEIARAMISREISGLPVMEEGAIAGIVTKSDILRSEKVNELEMMVGDLAVRVEKVNRFHSLDHILDIISEQNNKVIVMNDDGTIAGIITESNLAFHTYTNVRRELHEKDVLFLRREEAGGRKWFRDVVDVSVVAEDVMSRPVVTVERMDLPIQAAVSLMREHHINSVVIAKDRELMGIVKRDDIIQEVAK